MGNCCSAKATSVVNPDSNLTHGDIIVGRPVTSSSNNHSRVTPQPENTSDGSTLIFYERAAPDATANNLVSMCKQGKYAEVTDLISQGFDVNVKGMWSNTPLIAACQYNHESIVLRLLEEDGVDIHHINQRGGKALTYACLGGMHDAVEKLLSMGAEAMCSDVVLYNGETDKNDFITPLSAAVINGHSAIASKILESKPEAVDVTFSQYSKANGASTSPKAVTTGVTTLMLACKFAHVDIISYLIKHNVNCNTLDSDGNNILHYAAQSKNAEASLAALRDDRVLTPSLITMGDAIGDTPLHILCDGKKVAAVAILLKYLFSEEGKGKLRYERKSNAVAQKAAFAAVVEAIITQAMKNVVNNSISSSLTMDTFHLLHSVHLFKNNAEKTPLHVAVKRRSVDLVDALLEYGFDPNVKDASSTSPRDLALKLPKSSPILGKIDVMINKRKDDFEKEQQLRRTELDLQEQHRKEHQEKEIAEAGMLTPTASVKSLPPNAITNDKLCSDTDKTIPDTPIKPSTERKKKLTGLLLSPPSRQELFSEKRKSRLQAPPVIVPEGDQNDNEVEAKPETVDINDDEEVSKEDMDKQQEPVSDMMMDGVIEPPTVNFTTPTKSNGMIPSPEYTSGAKLNTAPVFSGSKENFTVVTSAPKKPQSGSGGGSGSGSSVKKMLKSTFLHPPPKLSFKNDIQ